MQGQHADRPARRHGRVSPTRHHGSRAAPIPRHSRQPHRENSNCFQKAKEEYGYKGENFVIYPIKVNQMQPVVEEIISHGKKFNLGLEAGSKPELHAVIAVQAQSDSLIICNGYKDGELHRTCLAGSEDGQAHLYRSRKGSMSWISSKR